MQLLDAPLAIVDLETTGAHPAHHRVTEIAVRPKAATAPYRPSATAMPMPETKPESAP